MGGSGDTGDPQGSSALRQVGLLALVFGGTLAVLLAAWVGMQVLSGRSAGVAAAAAAASPVVASESPSAAAAVVATPATPEPTAEPATPEPTASPTPEPTPEPSDSPTPVPNSGKPPRVVTVTVRGADFDSWTVKRPEGGTITKLSGPLAGAVMLESVATNSDAVIVGWSVPPGKIPEGAVVTKADVDVCGQGSGTFWEVYGPPTASTLEYEAQPPGAKGCWHFADGGVPLTASGGVMFGSRLRVDKVIFRVTYIPA